MVGGRAYLAMLTADVPSTANAGEYAKIVAEKAVTRRLIAASEEIVARGMKIRPVPKSFLTKQKAIFFTLPKKAEKRLCKDTGCSFKQCKDDR